MQKALSFLPRGTRIALTSPAAPCVLPLPCIAERSHNRFGTFGLSLRERTLRQYPFHHKGRALGR